MKHYYNKKLSVLSCVLSSAVLFACNGGNSSAGGQNQTGTTIQADTSQSLFATASCLSGSVDLSGGSTWYASGSVSISNTCASDQSLAGQTVSFTAQDTNGKAVAVGTLNNWWINDTSYAMVFTAGGGNTQIATISAGNGNPLIKANQTIVFSGGVGLTGVAFDNNSAKNSFAINGAAPQPTPSPTPTVIPSPSPSPVPTVSPLPSPSPSPTPAAAILNVVVDTSGAGCATNNVCNGLNVKVSDVSGGVVAQFTVPSSAYGATYTQPVSGLTANSNYTVTGSAITNATVSYTPATTVKLQSGSNTISVKYVKNAVASGSATISLNNYLAAYTGDLAVQIINAKESNAVVNSYTIKQGGSFSTGNLPISDSTHAYKIKLVSGIADPASGVYYIESGLPVLKISKDKVTIQSIPMKASTTTKRNVILALNGLSSGDSANVTFSDATAKYKYVNPANQVNGNIVYKIENNLNLGVSVLASSSNYEVNPINVTKVITANTTLTSTFATKVTPSPSPVPTVTPSPSPLPTTTPPPVSADKVVTVYLLIDTPAQLQQYIDDLNRVSKVNFNRVIFSFVKPTMTNYVSGNLANTGIMGYFNNGDGKGVAAFDQLKQAVTLSKAKNIQTFLSVGGWNYSCNFEVYGTNCGDAPTATNGVYYDWFPDPTDPAQAATAKVAYENVIKLTNDLGMQGIDLDAEEFWHADKYAVAWKPGSTADWSTEIGKSIQAAGGPTYANLMKYGAGGATSSGPAVMPKTVDKMAAIIHALEDNPNAQNLLFATAAPPVGARPITGFVYGDNNPAIYTKGGVWWLGNLKGLWYNLTDKEPAIVNRFDSIGLMTYDLCGDNATMCAPYGGGPLDLAGQVTAYMKDYWNWLKSTSPSAASLTMTTNGQVTFLPAKYNISPKLQFGFEVNQPAYPKNVGGQLQLTNSLVDTITSQQKDSGGVIIWQMYSKQNTTANGTTSKYTIGKSCKTFLATDSRYDCNADFPSPAK